MDRHLSRQIGITQELLADVLGARRESIRALVRQLSGDGRIWHSGHWVELRDRTEVEARTCECYALLTMEVGSAPHEEDAEVSDVATLKASPG